MKTRCLSLLAAVAIPLSLAFQVASASASPREEPPGRFKEVFTDGARICFLGDSITAGAQWCKVLTDYFYTRFPDRRYSFFNAGVGGDKAKESLLRLEEDVFVHRPDVVTAMFGMNDSNRYGGYVTNPTPRHLEMRNKSLDEYRETLPKLSDALAKGSPNAKICWFTPTPYDEFARLDSPTRPGRAEALGRCAEVVRRHASARGDRICELNAPVSEYNEREREADPSFTTLCGPDRVHPEGPGGFFMAQAILKSWGAPSCVSDVTIDASSGQCTTSENAVVSSISVAKGSVSFTVLEKCLPMPVAKDAKSVAEKTSFYESLNREYLRVKNLAPGNWTLSIDGDVVISASASQWSDGVNLSALSTPQARQAEKVSALNARRIAAEKRVRRLAPARHFLRSHVRNIDDWEEVVRVAKSFEGQKEFPKALLPGYLAEWPSREKYLDEARKFADEIYASNRPMQHCYTLTSGGNTTVVRNIPYDAAIGRSGLGDLYLPVGHGSKTPLVLCIHGGGWRAGDRNSWCGVAKFFCDELDFAAFNIEYRLAPKSRWPACGDDCVKAAQFVLSDDFKRQYGLSYDKIWICGGSAGGHLALWTLVNLPPESVAGAISISAIGDPLPDYQLHRDRYSALLGDEGMLERINPIALIKPRMAPLLCTHTMRDSVVPIASHRAFADAYRAAGNQCDFFEYVESSVHGIAGHRIWIPDSQPHKLIPEIEGAIRKFVRPKGSLDLDESAKTVAGDAKEMLYKRCADWRPVEMGEYPCVKGKSARIRELEIVPGTALDLSAIVPRYDIGANGRIVADSQGQLVFQNEPERPLRLRGFNCTYGGKYDGFQNASKEELEELAGQFRLMGLNLVRLHFFDAKLVGLSGLKWWKYRDCFAEDSMPQTKDEIDAIVDRDFLDRFHWFVKCLRDRGVYIIFDVATSPNKIMARAKKSRVPTRIGLFLDERWRKLWKASFDFWTQTINPYTGTRFLDDPQVIGMTFCNEQDWIFFSDQELAMFTTDFRKEFGEDMPELSRRLLWEDGKASENARVFFRRRLKEMTDFYLGVVKASGFKGLTTQWDMLKTPLGAESHIGLSAVATHSYHAHPKFSVPLPDGMENERILEPWNKGKCTEVPFGSSLAENKRTYFANAALARTLGKPFFVSEYSHIPANDCAQEAPVVQSAIAALQDWQALCPHSDLVQLWHYDPYPFFDEGGNLMARVSSVATAFGWQRGDIKRAPHAVSLSMTENVLASPALSGSLETAYVNLAFMTRVGVDAENAHNQLASLDIVPMREEGVGKGEPLANDIQTSIQDKSHSTASSLGEDVAQRLRESGVLPSDNRTDFKRSIFESETGEILTDLRNENMTIDAPRFQAAALKPGQTARLSQLVVESVSTPASIIAISLDGDRFVSCSSRVLLIVATRFMQEGAIVSEDGKKMLFIDNGPTYTQLMRTGQFRFSIGTEAKNAPEVYALRMNGTRSFKIPVIVRDGRLVFDLDTSKSEYATPFFEVVRKEWGK